MIRDVDQLSDDRLQAELDIAREALSDAEHNLSLIVAAGGSYPDRDQYEYDLSAAQNEVDAFREHVMVLVNEFGNRSLPVPRL